MTPATTLTSTVIATRTGKQGEIVGCGGAWVADRKSKIAIVAVVTLTVFYVA